MSTWKTYEVPVRQHSTVLYRVKARSVLEAVDKVEASIDFGADNVEFIDVHEDGSEVDHHGIHELP